MSLLLLLLVGCFLPSTSSLSFCWWPGGLAAPCSRSAQERDKDSNGQKNILNFDIYRCWLCWTAPLTERASLWRSSSADRPPAPLFSSPGPSRISAPPGSALPGWRSQETTHLSEWTQCRQLFCDRAFNMWRPVYLRMVLVEAEDGFSVQLLLGHHQLQHLLAVSTHDQLQRVLVFFQGQPQLWEDMSGRKVKQG